MDVRCKVCGKLDPCEHPRELVTDFHHVIPPKTPITTPKAEPLPEDVQKQDQEAVEPDAAQDDPPDQA